MTKKRSRTYIKRLCSKAVKYYFENPNTSLKELSLMFRVSETKISKSISENLKKRFDKSFARL